MLARLEGHLISGYADGGDAPDKQLSIVPGAVDEAADFLAGHEETRARFERVADLVNGFETAYGMELLASVHWLTTREEASRTDDAVRLTRRWNDRKRRYTEHQIHVAWDVLAQKGWIEATPV